MHGTRLYEAQKDAIIKDWEIKSKRIEEEQKKKESVHYFANFSETSTIAYGKKPQYRQKVKKRI